MALTQAQLTALKAAILADQELSACPMTPDGADAIAQALKQTAAPDFWVWRTDVTRAEVYHSTSPEGTTWNWTTYKAQSVPEQGAWVQMFMGDAADFGLPNLRAGVSAIFTGSAQQNAQRDHVLSVAKRKANRAEKIFATGVGSLAAPATMVIEGELTYQTIQQARALP